jgi:phosphatidyl-myo-inositol alpha-mannosyltransferase
LKIGLVSPYDYSFPGGVVQHIAHLAYNFQQQGHQVKILAPCLKEDMQYFEEEVTSIGRPIPVAYGGTVARIPLSPWLPVQIKKILKKEKFDILHLHEPFIPMLCMSTLIQSNTVNVGTFHAYQPKSKGYRPLKPVFKKLLKKLDGKIIVSQPLYDFLNKYVPSDYQIIPNGIDINRFTLEGPVKKEFVDGKTNILFVGRLEKRKGLEYLIRACGILKNHYNDFRLIVVGPGTRLRPRYERLAEQMGIPNVSFMGRASEAELAEYYRTADICCAPATHGESFGIVLLEAMACGKPVIASNIPGYASVAHHGNDALLAAPKNPESIAQALLQLINNKSLREQMGVKGRANAEKYSWSSVSEKVLRLYGDVMGASK